MDMNGGGTEEGKGSGMWMKGWDIQWTDVWSVSSLVRGVKWEEVTVPHCVLVMVIEGYREE